MDPKDEQIDRFVDKRCWKVIEDDVRQNKPKNKEKFVTVLDNYSR